MSLILNGITGDIPTYLVPEFTAKFRKRIKRKATLMFTTWSSALFSRKLKLDVVYDNIY